jgi:2-phosphosulfolactate phosphatase
VDDREVERENTVRNKARILRVGREQANEARGVVIVIDVIRAFSVAAYALAGGARELWLVRAVEEAVALREREPHSLLIGEVGGRLIPGFDHNNSPARMASAEVRGRLLIQRTGAGTQGAVGATGAAHLLICALVNAQATAAQAQILARRENLPITLLPTAALKDEDEHAPAIEDEVCADYLEALLLGRADADEVLAAGIARLHAIGRLRVFAVGYPDFPPEDVPAFLASDRYSFAMVGRRERWRDIDFVAVRRVDVPDN